MGLRLVENKNQNPSVSHLATYLPKAKDVGSPLPAHVGSGKGELQRALTQVRNGQDRSGIDKSEKKGIPLRQGWKEGNRGKKKDSGHLALVSEPGRLASIGHIT